MYITIDDNKRVTGCCSIDRLLNGIEAENIPEEFTFDNSCNWIYDDGEWTYDEVERPEP